jgi:hypothetical protein
MEERKGAGFRLARTVKICRGGRRFKERSPRLIVSHSSSSSCWEIGRRCERALPVPTKQPTYTTLSSFDTFQSSAFF